MAKIVSTGGSFQDRVKETKLKIVGLEAKKIRGVS